MLDDRNPKGELEVDGGIEPKTVPLAVEAGAAVAGGWHIGLWLPRRTQSRDPEPARSGAFLRMRG